MSGDFTDLARTYCLWLRVMFYVTIELLLFPLLVTATVVSRFFPRRFDVGLGPDPLINNRHHQLALKKFGYHTQTFVNSVYYITQQFDVRGDLLLPPKLSFLTPYVLYLRALFRYRCLYIYFTGGNLSRTRILRMIEPLLYRIADIKTVVMPFGGDVHDLSHCPNLLFKHAMSRDYPGHRRARRRTSRLLDLWTLRGDHVIGGCDWVDYLYHWDTLTLAHFSIDTDYWSASPASSSPPTDRNKAVRILHAPNHRNIKGTKFFIEAVEQLQREGFNVELRIVERVPNERIREEMLAADIVADQLVIGWYAMFALEAMSLQKPVLCYLRPDLIELYQFAGLIKKDEIPIVNCNPFSVTDVIRQLLQSRDQWPDIGRRSREFAIRHHSLDVIGATFDRINRSLGILPACPVTKGNITAS